MLLLLPQMTQSSKLKLGVNMQRAESKAGLGFVSIKSLGYSSTQCDSTSDRWANSEAISKPDVGLFVVVASAAKWRQLADAS